MDRMEPEGLLNEALVSTFYDATQVTNGRDTADWHSRMRLRNDEILRASMQLVHDIN